MKFKIDENLPGEVAQLLCNVGHDAKTVLEQQMSGDDDERIIDVCKAEGRSLITFDLDFSNITVYPPKDYAGIVVLRYKQQDKLSVLSNFQRLMSSFEKAALYKRLWIVDEKRLRIRE